MEQEQPRRKKLTQQVRLSGSPRKVEFRQEGGSGHLYHTGGTKTKMGLLFFSKRKSEMQSLVVGGRGEGKNENSPLLRSVMIPRGFPPKMEETWSYSWKSSCSKT